jgi:hypothetical protein
LDAERAAVREKQLEDEAMNLPQSTYRSRSPSTDGSLAALYGDLGLSDEENNRQVFDDDDNEDYEELERYLNKKYEGGKCAPLDSLIWWKVLVVCSILRPLILIKLI